MKIKSLFPLTVTHQLDECKQFYTELFGFEVVFEGDWYIQLRHVRGVEIALMKPDLPNQPKFLQAPYSGSGIVYSLEVDDAQSEYDRLKSLNTNFIYGLTDEEWGQRHFMLRDPAGLTIDVVQQMS